MTLERVIRVATDDSLGTVQLVYVGPDPETGFYAWQFEDNTVRVFENLVGEVPGGIYMVRGRVDETGTFHVFLPRRLALLEWRGEPRYSGRKSDDAPLLLAQANAIQGEAMLKRLAFQDLVRTERRAEMRRELERRREECREERKAPRCPKCRGPVSVSTVIDRTWRRKTWYGSVLTRREVRKHCESCATTWVTN